MKAQWVGRSLGAVLAVVLTVSVAWIGTARAEYTDLSHEKCKRKCDKKMQEGIEECQRRYPNPKDRPPCYEKVNSDYAQCIKDCDKKKPKPKEE